ncbi:hypothetical protein M758_8G189000 [Ceratodon purpureus]|uniref:Non-structural maintenance of chromosomes element 4 n=1 Tax=Ceratodon purpureus TaxID=3225 RepID=A0A8T0H586_CERPU|nr:hypothetical protein KC19_8G193800 [Ceratodon purpureus]KAG0609495.1 hypothetical protein M758_8G189000 [Ceratodon purpureus]
MSTQEERRRRREAKANARLEQGSQDDQENKMQEQDPEARKVLRSKYRELKQSIAEDDEELGRLDSNRFHELVDKMDDLSKEVMKPREQIADAEAVANLASKLLGNVRGMIRRSGTSPSAFVTAILAKFGNRTAVDGEVVEVQWGELGLEAIGFMREAPGVCTMLGPMDIEPKVRQAQAPRAKRARPTETARAEEVRDQGEAAAKSETDANMEIMFNILRRHRPARLDALVLNRHSFSQTVENIFSLSFLVKDGRAAITYDSDGTHLVAPKNAPSVDARQSGQVSNTQFVFRYDFNCWKVSISVFGVHVSFTRH